MSDREPRKRKKRKDGQKKEDLNTEEIPFSSKKFHEEAQKDVELEAEGEVVPHEPSAVARIVFFLLFSLLIVATGLVFIALHGADRSIDITNAMETSHTGELPLPEAPFPYTETEDWKPVESAKAAEEPHLWTDAMEDEEIIQPESLHEEETSSPLEENLETVEYYTQMPFEEITEQPQSEETEIFDREENGKEYIENYVDDNMQSYYDDDIEVFPITENNVDYESTIPLEHAESIISSTEEMQEPSLQATNELPIPSVESSVSSEEVTSKLLLSPTEESEDAEEHLRTSSETTDNSQAESPDNLNAHHTTESSDLRHEETASTVDYEHADITNKDDFQIKDELDEIDRIVDKEPGEDDIYFWF